MMRLQRRHFLHLSAGAAALPALSRVARAQAYPSRPITMIVPFAAGGPNDTVARIISDRMRSFLGQPVIVENAGGASGMIGVGRAVRAAADGYTLSEGSKSSHVLNGALYTLPYDLLKDLAPIARLASEPALIDARKDLPPKDLRELIAWLKANPGKASQGNAGRRHLRACHRAAVPARDGDQVSIRALSRDRAGDAGPGGRPDRHDHGYTVQCPAAAARRPDQGLRGRRQDAPRQRPRHPDRG